MMRRRQHQGGIALLEALLATLILAIGLLGTIGMQARAYSALSEASMRAEATIATEQLLGVIASDQANLASYALVSGAAPSAVLAPWYAATRASIPGALIDVTIVPTAGTARSEVDIRIRWTRKAGAPENVHQVTAYIST
jgi:type IV pilus assembly protein PilV